MEDVTNTQTVENTTNQNTGDTSTVTEGEKLYTQEEVNKFVSKRVKEVKAQFKDYDDLKNQVTDLSDKLKIYHDKAKQLETKYSETVFTSALESAAKELNLDVVLATKLLDRDKIIVENEKPSNIKELLQSVIEEHPNLVKKVVITPTVETPKPAEQKYSLHNTPNTSKFFNGSGLRLNHIVTKD